MPSAHNLLDEVAYFSTDEVTQYHQLFVSANASR